MVDDQSRLILWILRLQARRTRWVAAHQLGLYSRFWTMTYTPAHPFGSHFLVPASSPQRSPDPGSSGCNSVRFSSKLAQASPWYHCCSFKSRGHSSLEHSCSLSRRGEKLEDDFVQLPGDMLVGGGTGKSDCVMGKGTCLGLMTEEMAIADESLGSLMESAGLI